MTLNHYQFFEIKKLQWDVNFAEYMDISILTSKEPDSNKLMELVTDANRDKVKCCWANYLQYLNGFARAIRYTTDKIEAVDSETMTIKYADQFWEG